MSKNTSSQTTQATNKATSHLDAPLYDHDAELIVLKGLLLRGGALDEIEGRSPHLFHKPHHRWLFRAFNRMREGKELAFSPTALREALVALGAPPSEIELIIATLHTEGVPIAYELEYYWEKLERKAARRDVRMAGDRALADADDRSLSDGEVITRYHERAATVSFPGTELVEPLRQWPTPLGEAAYHGLAGEFARMIDPHTESDPAAIITQFLVEFGNVIGRNPHWEVEADQHHLNEFCVLVGATSKGRKGTSEAHVKRIIGGLDLKWPADCRSSGFASGEALINEVRDEVAGISNGEKTIIVPGVEDKRLMVVESEFARVLTIARRENSILSMVFRQAWDTGDLKSISKKDRIKATGAHVSVIGHITEDELRVKLDETEQANGFGNRHLWICTRRSKELPEGGQLHTVDFRDFKYRLQAAHGASQSATLIERDTGATALWKETYRELGAGGAGLYGAMVSRAEAHVMRIAAIYALLDCRTFISLEHLEAALEVWRYVRDSLNYLFGRKLGDPLQDGILSLLRDARPDGLTRSQLGDQLGRNYKSERLVSTIKSLIEHGLVRMETIQTEARGPKPTRLFAV